MAELPKAVLEMMACLDRGDMAGVRAGVQALSRRRLDREATFRVAQAARQAQLPEKALRLLHRYVRVESRRADIRPDARPSELTEYAASLGTLGATREALALLARPIVTEYSPSGLIEALMRIREWDWLGAERALRRTLAREKLHPVVRLASEVYLGSCLLHGRGDAEAALAQLERVRPEAERQSYGELARSASLLIGQASCALARWPEAADAIERARREGLAGGDPRMAAAAVKWQALLGLRRDGPGRGHEARLAEARALLAENKLWERVRGCDFYLALATPGSPHADELRARLRAGTPYPAFHAKFVPLLGPRLGAPVDSEGYVWRLGPPGGPSAAPWADVLTGRNSRSKALLKPGQVPQRLLAALASDFYKPFTAIELHELVFPGEYFNPETSVLKMHQATRRLRSWLRQAGLPLEIDEQAGFYRLDASAPLALRVPSRPPGSPEAHPATPPRAQVAEALDRLAARFKGARAAFSAAEAARALDVSKPTAVRYLTEAVTLGLLEREGSGPAVRYRVNKTRAVP